MARKWETIHVHRLDDDDFYVVVARLLLPGGWLIEALITRDTSTRKYIERKASARSSVTVKCSSPWSPALFEPAPFDAAFGKSTVLASVAPTPGDASTPGGELLLLTIHNDGAPPSVALHWRPVP